jgi:hypothetical protein
MSDIHEMSRGEDGGETSRYLSLCDCQEAQGHPSGLSCEKEGYFIGSFQRQGQWLIGGEPVPLSNAVCCRPCLPTDGVKYADIQPTKDGVESSYVAVISVGCHPSSDSQSPFQCEKDVVSREPTSFVVGFTSSARVFSPGQPAYYPTDAAECCTPSLLMEDGDVVELEPCDCVSPEKGTERVSCGEDRTQRLLTGFDSYRPAPTGHAVPVGDATCCRMCVKSNESSSMDCASLSHCSGRGSCILGRCECLPGWSGSSCSVRSGDDNIPPWAVAVIVIGSCLLGILIIGVLAYAAEMLFEWRERMAQNEGEDDEDSTTRPLLIQIDRDDDGSVGSEDTTDEDTASVSSDIEHRIHMVEQDLNADDVEDEEEAKEVDGQQESTSTAQPLQSPRDEQADDDDSIKRLKSRLRKGHGPLAGVVCNVCMDRPVQTVVVPCGHASMCRRCSRRLNRCPLCRATIARRQKLYVV